MNLVETIRSDRTWIWNAVELYNLYNPENEVFSSSWKDDRTLIKHLLDYFEGALVSFHARGYDWFALKIILEECWDLHKRTQQKIL